MAGLRQHETNLRNEFAGPPINKLTVAGDRSYTAAWGESLKPCFACSNGAFTLGHIDY